MKDNYIKINGKEIALSSDTIKEIKSKFIKSDWEFKQGFIMNVLNPKDTGSP